MTDNYAAFHVHTELSLLDSCTNYKSYVDKAVELNQPAIAFTEHGNIYNWIEKKMYCDKKGIKYIHGVECYLTESLDKKVRDNYHTILLAKNYDGVKEINKLIDLSTQEDHFYYKPRITFEEFFNISNNVIKISACLASPLNKYPSFTSKIKDEKVKELQFQLDEEIKHISKEINNEKNKDKWLKLFYKNEIFENVLNDYVEYYKNQIECVKSKYEKIINREKDIIKQKEVYVRLLQSYDYYEVQPHVKSLEQIKYNQMLYKASMKYNIPLIAGTDTHNISQYKAECRSILQKAKKIQFADEDEFDLTYKSYDELLDMFMQQCSLPVNIIKEALQNTLVMADSVEEFKLDLSFKYPKLYDDEEKILKARIVRMLKEKIAAGVIDKKKEKIYNKQIVEEFKVFKQINMIGFILFMSELICWCWDNDIPVGYCRGSVGGSTIAYICDIIDVDPIVWKTVFSRFANSDRLEVGDIDIDLDPDQRHLVYEHIIEQFGTDNTAYILAMGTISDKGTIDEIGRALNISLDEVASIKIQFENDPETTRKKYPDLFYYFDGLNGTVVSQSMHPAGIVVSPVTLPDNYGTFWSDGKRILTINMEECHEISLIKYDLLGLKNIGIIRKCCKYANIPYPKSHLLNWEDKKVWDDLITSPVGIFQFEGEYAFSLLKNYIPTCVNDLSLANAALRPSGESYRDRLLSRELNHNPSKLIDDLLAENNGYLVFQEDTIKFLQNICGLSGSEADNVRRAIGRKQMDRLQAALPRILEGYCKMSPQPREIAEEEAKQFLQIIEDSSNYQFGYNHSTGYSMIGYTCAYMRYYYPEEFIAAYLNCASNSDDIVNGTELAKLKNIKINNIKFGHSKSDYSVDKINHALYKGISSIKYCNSQIADELYELSINKYDSFIDLLNDINKTSINSRQLNILTGLNFFEDFGKNRYLLDIIELCNGVKEDKEKHIKAKPSFLTMKQVKKDKLEQLGLSEYLMQKYAVKETPKQYSQIDNIGLIKEVITRFENKSMNVVDQVKFEKDYLEYVIYTNPKVHKSFYIVTDFKTYKNTTTPQLLLHNIRTGEDVKTRIKKGKLFKERPFGQFSILKIDSFVMSNKKKNINGVWQQSDELEQILDDYEVIS